MINEEISGNTPSSETVPTVAVSDVVIEGNGKGQVFLECMVPGGKWVTVANVTGAFSLDTASTEITYRFRPVEVMEPVRVYFGP